MCVFFAKYDHINSIIDILHSLSFYLLICRMLICEYNWW